LGLRLLFTGGLSTEGGGKGKETMHLCKTLVLAMRGEKGHLFEKKSPSGLAEGEAGVVKEKKGVVQIGGRGGKKEKP